MTNFLKKYVSSIFIFSMCVKSELNLQWMLHFHIMHKSIFQRFNWGIWRVPCYKMLGARSVQTPMILKLPYWTSISKSYNPLFHGIYVIITSKHHRCFGRRSFLTMKVFTPKFMKIICYLESLQYLEVTSIPSWLNKDQFLLIDSKVRASYNYSSRRGLESKLSKK